MVFSTKKKKKEKKNIVWSEQNKVLHEIVVLPEF